MKKRILSFFTVAIMLLCIFPTTALAVGDVIDFTRDSLNLYTEQSYQLTLKSAADITEYRSSDPNIVSVNESGLVKAIHSGSSIITVTDNKGNQAACTVTVHTGTAPKSVELGTQSIDLYEGDTYTLEASVLPADADDTRLYFTSSDETVAKVDKDGVIKALKSGVAVISVESSSTAVSSKCMVKVNTKQGHTSFSVAITGVLYSIAGDKKANMVVELKSETAEERTTTDADGMFYFENIVQGDYTMNIYRTKQSKKAVASGKISIGAHDMSMSCIINDKEVVILHQSDTAGTAAIKDITLEKTTVNLEVGSSYDMVFKVKPSNAALPTMNGVSDNTRVAMVDIDGRITGLAEGSATITFKTSDGKFSRSCKVVVVSSASTTYSWIIIILESTIVILIVTLFAVSYRRFLKNKEREEGLIPPTRRRSKK